MRNNQHYKFQDYPEYYTTDVAERRRDGKGKKPKKNFVRRERVPNFYDVNTAKTAAKYALPHRRISPHVMQILVDLVQYNYKNDQIPFFTIKYLASRLGSKHRGAITHIIKELEALKFITRFERPKYLVRNKAGEYRKHGHAMNFRINFSRMRAWLRDNGLKDMISDTRVVNPDLPQSRTYADFLSDVVSWSMNKHDQKKAEKDRLFFLETINARICQLTHRASYEAKLEGLTALKNDSHMFPENSRDDAIAMIEDSIQRWKEYKKGSERLKAAGNPIKARAQKTGVDTSSDELSQVTERLKKIKRSDSPESIRERIEEEIRATALDTIKSRSEAKSEAILAKAKELYSQSN